MRETRKGCTQHAVWHNGGCNAAESLVKTCNVSTRNNISVPRHYAKLLPRCMLSQERSRQYEEEISVIMKTEELLGGQRRKVKEKQIMLLYLRYLNKNERIEGEESPIGLILCSEGNTEHIEYLMLEENSIRVAQYYTQLPDKKLLSEKLQRAIAIAKEHHAVGNKSECEY